MKQKLFAAGILFLLFFLIRCPQEALTAARDGMQLWLNTLLPTLLPFIILTSLLIQTNEIEKIFMPLKKISSFLLGLSPSGTYALVLGLLCGYPMGAKIASDLFIHKKISKQETEYLLVFSNNASPVFLATYLAHICLKDQVSISKIACILLLSNFITLLFFRFFIFKGKTVSTAPHYSAVSKKETSAASSLGMLLDVSIMNGFETITRLGGYILLFSIIAAVISHFWMFEPLLKYMVLGVLELTTGLNQLSTSGIAGNLKFLLSMCMTAFGGICIMAQTKSVVNRKISLIPYIFAKCMNTLITGLLVFTQFI